MVRQPEKDLHIEILLQYRDMKGIGIADDPNFKMHLIQISFFRFVVDFVLIFVIPREVDFLEFFQKVS